MATMKKDDMDEDTRAELARFLRGTPDGVRDNDGTELYEERQAREEAKEEAKEDQQEENERDEMQDEELTFELRSGDRAAAKTMERSLGGLPPDGDQLLQRFLSEEEKDRQMAVAADTFNPRMVDRSELRRRLQARGREGRIMKAMPKGGQAVKRKKR